MSERENKTPTGAASRILRCDEWETLIADALDSTLTAADAAAFHRHHNECALCAQMLKETQQGRDWMQYLAATPEPPVDLLRKILARTSENAELGGTPVAGTGVATPAEPQPPRRAWNRVHWSRWNGAKLPPAYQAVRQILEPRLLMTIAMAFFSIALTLNLTGINVSQIRAADLQPSRLRATLTRQYYATNEQVTKYYENLRVVYEMESRVRELRRSTEAQPAPSPRPAPTSNPPNRQRDGSGTPSSTVPQGGLSNPSDVPADGRGDAVLPASYNRSPAGDLRRQGKVVHQVFRALRPMTEDQAKRSLV